MFRYLKGKVRPGIFNIVEVIAPLSHEEFTISDICNTDRTRVN
jgi:hypothetical protein